MRDDHDTLTSFQVQRSYKLVRGEAPASPPIQGYRSTGKYRTSRMITIVSFVTCTVLSQHSTSIAAIRDTQLECLGLVPKDFHGNMDSGCHQSIRELACSSDEHIRSR